MRLLLHFARYGPYHRARLCALAEVLRPNGWEVIGLQTASTDSTYAWDESIPASPVIEARGEMAIRTAFPGRVYEEISSFECRRGLVPVLEELAPDAIAVAGWGTVDARITLRWCRKKGVKAIIMSETREVDGHRVWWKERLKSMIIQGAHGALVGGISHRDYLVKLGIPAERIRLGYNVVDNAYFAAEAKRWRGAVGGGEAVSGGPLAVGGGEAVSGRPLAVGGGEAVSPMPPYFLASNRFIERKNLGRLIEAYAQFCRLPIDFAALWTRCLPVPGTHLDSLDCPSPLPSVAPIAHCPPPTANGPLPTAHRQPPTPWSLVLLGDGPQRSQLISRCHELGLTVIESAPWEMGGQEGGKQWAVGGESAEAGKEAAFEDAAIPRPDDKSSTANSQPPTADRNTADRNTANSPPPTERPPTTNGHSPPANCAQPTAHCSAAALPRVYFPGFRQIEELPRFYAHAGAFIHPALEEPWGLVINEAMASGLPVLSGNNVGAAAELIEEGKNGWTFDARDVNRIAEAMEKLASLPPEERIALGLAGSRILEERDPTDAFGRGLADMLE